MGHVTFIHGLGNKTAPDVLIRNWQDALALDSGLLLEDADVSSRMVYWADVMYERPLAEYALERVGDEEEAPEEDFDVSWIDSLVGNERDFVSALRVKLAAKAQEADPTPGTAIGLRAIPLPRSWKIALMNALLRDVHHYLFNVEHSPRPGERLMVQKVIRARVLEALQYGASQPRPHVVVTHSMGTVIAYDCLKRTDVPRIDALMTIGSPLGIDEVQDELTPEYTRADGFPSERVMGEWVNVYDRLDLVAAFDPILANDYLRGGEEIVTDVHEPNSGLWRHSIDKYLRGPKLRSHLRRMLELA